MWIASLIVALVLVALGILFMNGKGAFLIAGYNTSSKAEQDKFDKLALCKFMGKSVFAISACWLIVGLSDIFDSMFLLWMGIGLFFAVIIFMLVYANTGNRFRKKD